MIEPVEVVARFASVARPVMRQFMGAASCIGAARTTIEVMRTYGLRAIEIPTWFVFQVVSRKYARIVGFSGAELEEMKAKSASWEHVTPEGGPGWEGHLIVLVENRWLIDPSLDGQVDDSRFGVSVAEMFVIDTFGQNWNPNEYFEMNLGLILDNGDHAKLFYRRIEDTSYRETDAWKDEGLGLLAHLIAIDMERSKR